MDTEQLLNLMANGEDSRHQFKANVTRSDSLAQEMVAFSNTKGGMLLIGVADDGSLSGLSSEDMGRINQLVSNAATEHMRPPISPLTQNVSLPQGKVMLVSVPEGVSKPYMDKHLHVYVKSGADKRKVTAREELQRMFQVAALVHADELPVANSSVADVDRVLFDEFFEREYAEVVEQQALTREQLLENMNLAKAGRLNISGTLLFSLRPYRRLPVFIVKAASFPSVYIEDEHYIDSRDIKGNIASLFQETLNFLLSNIQHRQNHQSVNSVGQPEIPRIVFEELVANALIHRDYFISAPIRVLVFSDRVEITSPGHLPNNLSVDNIKRGNSNIRNPILASFAAKMLPYRGLGSGILRAIKAYPAIEFIDDREGNQFNVVIRRLPCQR